LAIIQQLCAAHVIGRPWLGAVPKQGPAIYLECEDAESVLWRRLAAVAEHYQVPIETFANDLHLFSLIEHDTILAVTDRYGVVKPTAAYQRLYEMAGDIKPVQVGIASVANVFAGNENVRTEVQQFIKLMSRITKLTRGSLALVAHPSLTGLSDSSLSHAGLSGTTQWHNAVRSRAAQAIVKPKDSEQTGIIDTGLRSITFYKNQYGPPAAACFVRWSNGLFLPVEGTVRLAGIVFQNATLARSPAERVLGLPAARRSGGSRFRYPAMCSRPVRGSNAFPSHKMARFHDAARRSRSLAAARGAAGVDGLGQKCLVERRL
jgi:RecA-family ATPase